MKPSSSISSKGQVTVPQEIRSRLGLKTGDRVEFVIEGNRTTIRPARAAENPFLKYAGALPAFGSVPEINAWVHALRDEEPAEKR
jgi:antitoxin PrlF